MTKKPTEPSPELVSHVEGIANRYASLVNETPGLLSLLYDIDLLPEQLSHVLHINPTAAGANASRMAAVCKLWKRQRSEFTNMASPEAESPP